MLLLLLLLMLLLLSLLLLLLLLLLPNMPMPLAGTNRIESIPEQFSWRDPLNSTRLTCLYSIEYCTVFPACRLFWPRYCTVLFLRRYVALRWCMDWTTVLFCSVLGAHGSRSRCSLIYVRKYRPTSLEHKHEPCCCCCCWCCLGFGNARRFVSLSDKHCLGVSSSSGVKWQSIVWN